MPLLTRSEPNTELTASLKLPKFQVSVNLLLGKRPSLQLLGWTGNLTNTNSYSLAHVLRTWLPADSLLFQLCLTLAGVSDISATLRTIWKSWL